MVVVVVRISSDVCYGALTLGKGATASAKSALFHMTERGESILEREKTGIHLSQR